MGFVLWNAAKLIGEDMKCEGNRLLDLDFTGDSSFPDRNFSERIEFSKYRKFRVPRFED